MQTVTMPCAKRPTLTIRSALGLIGFSAVIGQIVLMREFIVVFNGNEACLGIVLATWLLWTSVGSSVVSRTSIGRNNARRAVAALECLLGITLLLTIWILPSFRIFFQVVPGELVGPVPTLLTTFSCLSVFCALSGSLFVVAARMYQQECDVSDRRATSFAYVLEAAGSAFAGLLTSIVLLPLLNSFQLATIVLLVNFCMAAILLSRPRRKHFAAIIGVATLIAIPLLLYVAPSLDRSAQRRLWRGFDVLESRDSIYGNLVVVQTGNLRSIYDNGVILANAPDPSAAEEAVHYALLEHLSPKQVLLIGGGVNGSIVEALKHPTLRRLDYVELDPTLIRFFRQFFPAQAGPSFADARVHFHYADARHYLLTTADTFDVIILDAPEPQTAQLNRFYTVEFFRAVRDHLASGGVLALQLRSSEDYLSPELAEFLRCIHYTLQQVFPQIVVIPGETIHFFAAMRPNELTDDSRLLVSRLKDRKIETQYVREYFIPFRMMPDRMQQVHSLLHPLAATPINHDFTPVAYYFDVILWSSQFRWSYTHLFRSAAQIRFGFLFTGVLIGILLVTLVFAYMPGPQKRVRATAACCVAITGFTLMVLQIFLLLAFQCVYGYVYSQLAILIGMFMAGISLGSWLSMTRIRSRGKTPPIRVAAVIQFLLALSAPVLLLLITFLSRASSAGGSLLVTQIAFPALAALSGMLGGYQFPLATEIYLGHALPQGGLGTLYALDLLGGCAGALCLSAYLIPVFGFWNTGWLSAVVNLAPLLLVLRLSVAERVRA